VTLVIELKTDKYLPALSQNVGSIFTDFISHYNISKTAKMVFSEAANMEEPTYDPA